MKETTVKQAIEREREVEEQGIQIQIENVSMTFKDNDGNDVQALKNINLNVKKGNSSLWWAPPAAARPRFCG